LKNTTHKYIAFLRGINVGGHHKVPMKDLVATMQSMACSNISTLLNSGNVIFESAEKDSTVLENLLEEKLEQVFNFPIPTIVRNAEELLSLISQDPFKQFVLTKDLRFYVSFLKNEATKTIEIPWHSDDDSFKILNVKNKTIISILDVSKSNSPKGMDALERIFGKEITTRNWNTLQKIVDKI